jgi:hypothetical protein
MKPSRFVQTFGILVLFGSAVCLVGWYVGEWSFVDPFLATLFFLSAPFFVTMGGNVAIMKDFGYARKSEQSERLGSLAT